MDILDDEFLISNYITKKNNKLHDSAGNVTQDKIEEAILWSSETMIVIIVPTTDLFELENQWIKFNEMHKKQRRESDWKSIELFGMTNKDHYDMIKSDFLGVDINNEIDGEFNQLIQSSDTPISESYIDDTGAESYYETDELNYTTEDVENARKWANESNRVIILPTRSITELESLWDAFNLMISKHKRESDWMSQELFGVTNLRHYEYLKSQFLRDDFSSSDLDKYGSIVESTTSYNMKRYFNELCKVSTTPRIARTLLEANLQRKGIYEDFVTNNLITSTLDTFGDISEINPSMGINYGDMPYFSPDEMINMGINSEIPSDNYYGVSPDNTSITEGISVAEWFEMYRASYDGFYTEFSDLASSWVNKVRSLTYGLKRIIESGDQEKINARKQSILELGWNPEIEFTDRARMIARESAIHNMANKKRPTKVIDLRGFRVNENENTLLTEDSTRDPKEKLYPVYIVLTEGKSLFSKAIKGVTRSIYSHASISLDSTLEKMYSYGVSAEEQKQGKMKGGFRVENVKDLSNENRIGVYTFFVKLDAFEKIKALIESFKKNVTNTAYSYTNILTILFNIPYNTDWNLICSQFVDRCLKVAGIDITKKDSSLVSPANFDKIAKSNNRIYNVYEGLATSYNASKIKRLVNALSRKAVPIKEQNSIYYKNENTYISGIIANINDVDFLMEMRSHIDLVNNPTTRKILEEVLFDALDIRAYCEVKEFPVQFDKEGNLLIRNLKRINFNAEYAKSHRLLKGYEKSKNVEGMKYELSKLWMMNCLIEDKINPANGKKSNATDDDYKARANILNDFKYYMEIVMKIDPDFNFTEYYDNSPFSSATMKINGPTLDFMGKMIGSFLKSIV